MTVAENIYRGVEPTKGIFHFVDYKKMYQDAEQLLEEMGLNINPYALVGKLSIAQQQMVEIASAVSKDSQIVIMDEPTASLTDKEVKSLFNVIRELKKKNKTIIYVSHRMDETFTIGDRVTVMRDGTYIDTKNICETTADELVSLMVGRQISSAYGERHITGSDEVVLQVKGYTNKKLKNVSFELRRGEILGISGLVGSGRTELARAIFGLDKISSGEIYIENKKVEIKSPQDAIKNRMGFIPEDRRGAGLILSDSIAFNLTLTVLEKFIRGIHVDRKKELSIVDKYINTLDIKTTGPSQLCRELSGGNQQKVVISKWMATEPKYLIMDEPTRGIDVGAKKEIYDLMNRLAAEGISIIFISSDLPEIINLSHRVIVMNNGEITKVIDARETELTQEEIMKYSIGGMKSAV